MPARLPANDKESESGCLLANADPTDGVAGMLMTWVSSAAALLAY